MNPNFVQLQGKPYYKIENSQALTPFFINVPSASDIWIFLGSTGGLTAGRKNADGNIFPYETDDRLMQNCPSGSKTLIRVGQALWQPFANTEVQPYQIQQNIYKSCYASSVVLEEINETLSLAYRYEYQSSEQYGFVKTATLTNLGDANCSVEVLDGMSNILPYGVNATLQANSSNLVDGYRVAELVGDNMAVYSLSTTINDTPNPIEPLKANICYNTKGAEVYLSAAVTKLFAEGKQLTCPRESLGGKSGYYITYAQTLAPHQEECYSFVMDSGYDHSALAATFSFVERGDFDPLFADIEKGVQDLITIVEKADGLQQTGDEVATATHYLSTLYNCMRGGIFENGYALDYADFLRFVGLRNVALHQMLQEDVAFTSLNDCTTVQELKAVAAEIGNADLQRLALEYLPLSFSRRHGDPSRPWNKFNIAIKDENGDKSLYYEGNWRDIFQNWEALGLSFPAYYQNMVAKFVNASTFDGFNPYRITTVGIDWEKPEPENPFSGLGYWGDHQIIYLLRLLQGLEKHYPAQLETMLSQELFSYANVPYRIAPYAEIVKDSKNTMSFDFDKDAAIEALLPTFGSDGRLILSDKHVLLVSLVEKLLVPALSKVSNLMVGGGIWMNTARPEWNDANNAIVGIGLSMVTVYHLNAYLDFLLALFANQDATQYVLTENVAQWLGALTASLASCEGCYDGKEKQLLDALGNDFDAYRNRFYANGLGEKAPCGKATILAFLQQAKAAVSETIARNKTDVFASYNLLGDDFSVSPMQAMLEGQSAAVGSGCLEPDGVCALVKSMQDVLFSELHQAHTLYPMKRNNRFFAKNTVSPSIGAIAGIVHADCNGELHFDSDFHTLQDLLAACEAKAVSPETIAALAAEYERLFAHKKFTGRSGVMYKFEGIGCVYWHQNAKFLLAILETAQRAKAKGEDITEIYALYNQLLQGFIYRKTPQQCNAIPIEPYSHSSYTGKSEQPGMTGQVKESLLMRRGELGVLVHDGKITFDPSYLRAEEFDAMGMVCFSICAVPVRYQKGDKKGLAISFADGRVVQQDTYELDTISSKKIFERTGEVDNICIVL